MENESKQKTTKACKFCKTEIHAKAKFCPNCRKKQGLKIWQIVLVSFLALGIIGNLLGGEDSDNSDRPASSSNTKVTTTTKAKKMESIELQLTSGNYTVGIDIPAGKYNIEALSGNGNVSSSNMFSGGINAVMGKPSNGFNEQFYENIKLAKDDVLSVSGGVIIKVTSDSVDVNSLSVRAQPLTETIELGNGHFIAGEDFTAGVYDIVAISGGGNVSSSNMYDGGINAIMGKPASDFYEAEYMNINLSEGVELSVDGVKIKLVPSK